MNLYDRFLRWRRTRGYGIHSPLAFRLIWRVMRPERHIAYYGCDYLEGNRRAELLLRLVAEVQPSFVWISKGTPEVLVRAVRHAGGVTRIFEGDLYPNEIGKADMIIVYKERLKVDALKRVLKPPVCMAGFEVSSSFISKVAKYLGSGVMLEGGNSFVALCREDVSPMVYSVSKF